MLSISYETMLIIISVIWVLLRFFVGIKNKKITLKRELQLLLVYICLAVVMRFTFFPFEKVDGKIQPLILDCAAILPFNVNVCPIVYLLDYPERRDAILNIVGNTAMFIPIGIVWPAVYRNLDSHKKVIAAGVGFSLSIEILQLPFYDRVTDIDDLLLNSLGFLIGYGVWLLVRKVRKKLPHKGG